jgi:hypothetical protein
MAVDNQWNAEQAAGSEKNQRRSTLRFSDEHNVRG